MNHLTLLGNICDIFSLEYAEAMLPAQENQQTKFELVYQ
jgi:hypothetical protein